MSGFFEILKGVQELQSGREIANGQTDGHRGDNIIRPLRVSNKGTPPKLLTGYFAEDV